MVARSGLLFFAAPRRAAEGDEPPEAPPLNHDMQRYYGSVAQRYGASDGAEAKAGPGSAACFGGAGKGGGKLRPAYGEAREPAALLPAAPAGPFPGANQPWLPAQGAQLAEGYEGYAQQQPQQQRAPEEKQPLCGPGGGCVLM